MTSQKGLKVVIQGILLNKVKKRAIKEGFDFELPEFTRQLIKRGLKYKVK